MTGYEAFTLYNALKLHFTSEKYDYFKYKAKSRTSIESFEKRKDKYYFYKLSRQQREEDYIQFLVSNLLEKPDSWVGELLQEESLLRYKERMAVIQSLSYKFKNDCELLRSVVEEPNNIFVTKGEYPVLLTKTLQKEINIETLCILNSLVNFFPLWRKKIQDTIHWPNFYMKCVKYTPFIEYDKSRFRQIAVDALK
jgi:hypothetical protein